MSSSCTDVDLHDLLESLRRGEVVRVVSDKYASATEAPGTMGHLVLAAERASAEALTYIAMIGLMSKRLAYSKN